MLILKHIQNLNIAVLMPFFLISIKSLKLFSSTISNSEIIAAILVIIVLLILLNIKKRSKIKNCLRTTFFSVKLPKKETSLDKEKETARDFKEVISSMDQLFAGIASFRLGFFGWLFRKNNVFGFTYACIDNQIHFFVTCPERHKISIEKLITSYYPDAKVDEVDAYNIFSPKSKQAGCLLKLAHTTFNPLRTYEKFSIDPINSITNVLSKFNKDEGLAIQILIQPIGDRWAIKARKTARNMYTGKNKSILHHLFSDTAITPEEKRLTPAEEEHIKDIETKASKRAFRTTIRIVASSDIAHTAHIKLDNVVSTFTQFDDPHSNSFKKIKQNTKKVTLELILQNPSKHSSILSTDELASIFHFPNSIYNATPNIIWQRFRLTPAPENTPNTGLFLANNFHRGITTPIYIQQEDRFRHMYLIGQTGTGKSNFLEGLIHQDIHNGNGICVIDPHGELAEKALSYITRERADDVIYFNPADTERPMGLNLLEAKDDKEMDRIAMDALDIMIRLFTEEIFSPRLQDYFRNGVITLMSDKDGGGTLTEIVRLFTDENFQRQKVSKLKNPVVRDWWINTYNAMGQREKSEMIPYFAAKFGGFITDSTMRNIIGQAKSGFDFADVMDQGKILVINLSKGLIGDFNAKLLGMVIVSKLQMAAMKRAKQESSKRTPFFVYIDEFQNFVTPAIESILSEARKYKFGLTIAHQYIGQLEQIEEIKKAVFGNIGTTISFKVGPEDGEYLSRVFAPTFSEQDLINIDRFNAIMKLSIGNQPSAPFTIKTIPAPAGNTKVLEAIRQLSRLKYARNIKFVEREILSRLGTL